MLSELHLAWTEQFAAKRELDRVEQQLTSTEAQADWWARCARILDPLEQQRAVADAALQRAEQAAAGCAEALGDAAARHAAALRQAWDRQLGDAAEAARTVADGPGRFGLHRGRVQHAQHRLDAWAAGWAPVVAGSGVRLDLVRRQPAGYPSAVAAVGEALDQHAQRLAAADLPDQVQRLEAAARATAAHQPAAGAYHDARQELAQQSGLPAYDTGAAERLPQLRARVAAARDRTGRAEQCIGRLTRDPAITGQPDPAQVVAAARQGWEDDLARAIVLRRLGLTEPHRPASMSPAGPSRPGLGR